MPREPKETQFTQDRRIDGIDYRLKTVESAVLNIESKVTKDIPDQLQRMADGYVGRREYDDFKKFIGSLATQKDLGGVTERVKKLEDNQSKVVWIVLTAVILAILGTVIITKLPT
jgi:hypothetical protein